MSIQKILKIVSLFFIFFFILIGKESLAAQEVYIVKGQDIPLYREAIEGFKNIYTKEIAEFDLHGDAKNIEKVVAKGEKRRPDLIVSIGLLATMAVTQQMKQTPILFSMVFDPGRFSLSGPHITAMAFDIPPSTTLTRAQEILPHAKRVGVLYDPTKTSVSQIKKIARSLGITLVAVEVTEKTIPVAMREITEQKIDCLWLIPDSTVVTPPSLDFILLTSFEHHLPVIAFSDDIVKKGALAAIYPNYRDIGEQMGHMATQILRGGTTDHEKVYPLLTHRLSINLKTAFHLGLKINNKIVRAADKIYD